MRAWRASSFFLLLLVEASLASFPLPALLMGEKHRRIKGRIPPDGRARLPLDVKSERTLAAHQRLVRSQKSSPVVFSVFTHLFFQNVKVPPVLLVV